jgi:hypothetical protein
MAEDHCNKLDKRQLVGSIADLEEDVDHQPQERRYDIPMRDRQHRK